MSAKLTHDSRTTAEPAQQPSEQPPPCCPHARVEFYHRLRDHRRPVIRRHHHPPVHPPIIPTPYHRVMHFPLALFFIFLYPHAHEARGTSRVCGTFRSTPLPSLGKFIRRHVHPCVVVIVQPPTSTLSPQIWFRGYKTYRPTVSVWKTSGGVESNEG